MATNYINAVGVALPTTGAAKNVQFGTSAADTLVGTAANDVFRGNGGGDTFSGGAGDDMYIVSSSKDVVIEAAGQGIDTVRASSSYTLSQNVENLTLEGTSAVFATGNNLDNIIIGSSGNNQIDGGAGNDVLIGGAGRDTFIIAHGNGNDAIKDFNASADQIRLVNYGMTSFSQVQAITSQLGSDTHLNFNNGEKLILNNVKASSLSAANFQLMQDKSGLTPTFSEEFDSLSLYSLANKSGLWNTSFSIVGGASVHARTIAGLSSVYVDAAFAGTGKAPLGIDPFSIDDGILTITSAPTPQGALQYLDNRAYTGGLLTSRTSFSQEYGYFEIRAAMPKGAGMYSAFWMLPTDGSWPPELDVFEVLGKDPSTVFMSSHDNVGGKDVYVTDLAQIDTTQFHTYGVDWGPEVIKYYIDGNLVTTQATPPSMNKEMYFLVNLGVGSGGWIGAPNESTGTGQMKVDYIRAYATADTVSTTINKVQTIYKADPTPTTPKTPATPVEPKPVPPTPVEPKPVFEQVKGTANADTLVGTSAKQELWGLAGNDTLRGGQGETTMRGGAGNDVYSVTSAKHFVVEEANEGTDSVNTTISFTLSANVENMTLAGTANIDGTGNGLDNRIIGNTGNNVIIGLDGNDHLDGGTAGLDTLIGGTGNDFYSINHVGTTIVEKAGEGTDSVSTTISFTLSANVENMTLAGTAKIDGTGNALANRIVGNSAANVITGMGGNDTLTGGGGNDTFAFSVGFGKDVITDFNSAIDTLQFTGMNKAAMKVAQSGSSVVIDFGGGDSVTLLNTKVTDPALMSHMVFF